MAPCYSAYGEVLNSLHVGELVIMAAHFLTYLERDESLLRFWRMLKSQNIPGAQHDTVLLLQTGPS